MPRKWWPLMLAGAIVALAGSKSFADEQARLIASDGATADGFAASVAISGDTAVVGARFTDNGLLNSNRGSAYVFVRTGCTWTQRAKLIASDAATDDLLGASVSIFGDVVVVGAIFDDIAFSNQGSAYVFVKPAGGWSGTMTQTAKLTASDAAVNDGFGTSVCIDGDTIVIGASSDDGIFTDQGSAYVFVKPSGGWVNMTQTAKLIASDPATTDVMGSGVTIVGDTVAISADRDDGAFTDQGSVYVFVKPGGGWADMTQLAKLTASDAASLDTLGLGLSISGDTLVAGARFKNSSQGAAYVFVKPPGGWTNMTQSAKLTASDGAASDLFGSAVSISGETIAVGAGSDDGLAGANQGAVYKFLRPPGGWVGALTENEKLTASDASANDQFGSSVALSSTTLLVGAVMDDVGVTDQGSGYVYDGNDSDGDGVPDCGDVCASTPAGLIVDSEGRPRADFNNDCLVNGLDLPLITQQLLIP
jgi:hypothetical protein